MANEPQNPGHDVDGGAPTDEEARLAAQVDTIGDNPQSEPDAAPPAKDDAQGEDAAAAAPAPAAPAAAAEDAAPPASAPAPAPAAAAAEPAAPAAAPPPALPPRPESPKDFKAELDALQKQYDDGDIDSADFQGKQRELFREEARYEARVALYDERVQTATQDAQTAWNQAAVAWEQAHADYMANPLRADAMQKALALVDQQQPGLAPAKLFEAAQKIAFEAYNWATQAPAAAEGGVDAAAAIAAAIKAREGKPVPQTLASAPAAAQIETRGNASYAELDSRDISDLEDALARMTPAQQEAFLRDAPGANSNDPSPRERRDQ